VYSLRYARGNTQRKIRPLERPSDPAGWFSDSQDAGFILEQPANFGLAQAPQHSQVGRLEMMFSRGILHGYQYSPCTPELLIRLLGAGCQ
jgi:hypothetical protein